MLEKLHNWIYFKYSVSIPAKTLGLLMVLAGSLLFLFFSFLINNTKKPDASLLQEIPVGPASMPIPQK